MQNKEKIIMYVWIGSLSFIFIVGFIIMMLRPSKEVVDASQDLISMSEKIRKHYSNKPDYWGLSNQEIIKQKLYSGIINNNQIINSLGKKVLIGGDTKGTTIMPGMKSFIISYLNLTKKECIFLSTFKWTELDNLGLISISINNGKAIKQLNWGEDGLPLQPQEAKEYCSDNNDISWTFE